MTSLTVEAENKKLIRRTKEELTDHDVGAFETFFAEDYEAGMVRSGDETLELVAEGDRVVTSNEVAGTHEGTFRGIEPTGTVGRPTLLAQLGADLPIRG